MTLFLSLSAASAFTFNAPLRAPVRPAVGTLRATPTMDFSFDEMFKSVTDFFVAPDPITSEPSIEEIEELCRDEESSGCDVDMLEKLRADSGRSKQKMSP